MTEAQVPGRGLVTARAVGDVVRRAALASYGVVGVAGPRPWHTALAWVGRATPGVRVRLGPPLTVDLYLAVARSVPVAEVARNVDSAVRYSVRRALGRELDALAIHIDRLQMPTAEPGTAGSGPPSSTTGPGADPTSADPGGPAAAAGASDPEAA